MKRETQTLDSEIIEGGTFWAILDSTDTPVVPRRLRDEKISSVSLYKGEAEEKYWDIAPYLVRLDTTVFGWIQERLWFEPWGIAFRADASLEDLRKHFRKFLLVKTIDGEELYFRFYDPRVLNSFLPTCKDAELADFFGPVEEFWAKNKDHDSFEVFRR